MNKVLIADDDLAIVDSISLALEDEGYITRNVTDDTIVAVAKEFKPDIVLLDIWLSNLHGGEVCREIKATDSLSHAKVILISANKDIASIAGECGADDFLAKPLDLETLFSKIKLPSENDTRNTISVSPTARKTAITVLIVDDDDCIRDSIKLSLQAQDAVDVTVIESSNVDDGIALAKQIQPDVVILDLHMPNKTGYDFMDEVNQGKILTDTEFIMLTGDNTIANVFKAESKNIKPYRFIGKPFEVSELQALVFEAAGLLDPEVSE